MNMNHVQQTDTALLFHDTEFMDNWRLIDKGASIIGSFEECVKCLHHDFIPVENITMGEHPVTFR